MAFFYVYPIESLIQQRQKNQSVLKCVGLSSGKNASGKGQIAGRAIHCRCRSSRHNKDASNVEDTDKNPADKNPADKNPTDKTPDDENPKFRQKPRIFLFQFFLVKKYGVMTLFTIYFSANESSPQTIGKLPTWELRATLNEKSLIATAQATPMGIVVCVSTK